MKKIFCVLFSFLLLGLSFPVDVYAASMDGSKQTSVASGAVNDFYFLQEEDFPDKASYRKYQKALKNVLSNIDKQWKDEEKLFYIHDYIVTHTEYETPSGQYPAAYDVLINHVGICATYSMAFNELAHHVGIESKYVVCWEFEPAAHGWNMVKLNNKWYFVDCTWDDNSSSEFNKEFCSHGNFLLSEKAFRATGHNGKDWLDFETDEKVNGLCKDTTYDNAKWRWASEQPVACLSNGIAFYNNFDQDIFTYNCNRGKSKKIAHSEDFGVYADVISKDDRIFIYGDNKLYSIDKNNKMKVLYKLSKAEKRYGVISNIKFSGDLLRYDIGKNALTDTYSYNYKVAYTGYLNISKARSLIKPKIMKSEFQVNNITYKPNGSKESPKAKVTKITGSSANIPASINYNGISYKVTSIGAKAASENSSLKTVTIGNSVKSIGKKAFYNCSKLKKINIKSTQLKSVGTSAFQGVAKKPTVTVPKTMKRQYKNLLKKAGLRDASFVGALK